MLLRPPFVDVFLLPFPDNRFLKKKKKKKNLFIYLFLATLGLRCCAQAFSSCGEPGLLFVVVPGFLIVVAFLVAEQGL